MARSLPSLSAEGPPVSGRFVDLKLLSEQGQRRVFKARDLLTGAWVALKGALVPAGTSEFSPQVLAEFELLRHLPHPGLERPLMLGRSPWPESPTEVAFHFLAAEWIGGNSLVERRGRLTLTEMWNLAEQLLSLVAYLHGAGLVHLDIKPAHLIETSEGWRLIDLDLATRDSVLDHGLRHGTAPYLAPEALMDEDVGAASDLYTVGVILLEAASGLIRLPRADLTLREAGQLLLDSPLPELPPLLLTEEAESLAGLVRGLLAPRPGARPASAEDALTWLGIPRNQWRARVSPPHVNGYLPAEQLAVIVPESGGPGGGVVWAERGGGGLGGVADELAVTLGQRGWWCLDLRGCRGVSLLAETLRKLELWAGREEEGGARVRRGVSSQSWDLEVWSLSSRLREVGELLLRTYQRGTLVLVGPWEHLDELEQAALFRVAPYLKGVGLCLVAEVEEGVSPGQNLPLLKLPPLDEERVWQVARKVLGSTFVPSPERINQLLTLSDHQPGPLWQILTWWWQHPDEGLESWVPGHNNLGEILQQLSPPARKLACAMSVVEGPIALGWVVGLTGSEQPMDLVGELLRSGLWMTSPSGVGSFMFVRESLRLALKNTLPLDERISAHLLLAEVLALAHLGGEPTSAGDLAHHFIEAGDQLRAQSWVTSAVEEAVARRRPDRAFYWLTSWRKLLAENSPLWVTATLRMGELELERSRWEAAINLVRPLLHGSLHLSIQEQIRAAAVTGIAQVNQSQYRQGIASLRRALDLVEVGAPGQFGGRVGMWWSLLVSAHVSGGEVGPAREALQRAEAHMVGDTARLDLEYRRSLLFFLEKREPEELIDPLVKVCADAARLGYHAAEVRLRQSLVRAYSNASRYREARSEGETSLRVARRLMDPRLEASCLNNLALTHIKLGDKDAAVAAYLDALDIYVRDRNVEREISVRLELIPLLLQVENTHRAEKEQRLVEAQLQSLTNPRTDWALRSQLSDIQIQRRMGDGRGLLERLGALRLILQEQVPASSRIQELRMGVELERAELWLVRSEIREVLICLGEVVAATPSDGYPHYMADQLRILRGKLAEVLASGVGVGGPELPESALKLYTQLRTTSLRNNRTDEEEHESRWFYYLQELMSRAGDPRGLLDLLGQFAGEWLGGHAYLCLKLPGQPVKVVRGHQLSSDQVDDLSRTLVATTIENNEEIHIRDLAMDPRTRNLNSLRGVSHRGVYVLPIQGPTATLGAVYLSYPPDDRSEEQRVRSLGRRIVVLASQSLGLLYDHLQKVEVVEDHSQLIGTSSAMQAFRMQLRMIGMDPGPQRIALLLGEMGTGKSTAARILHRDYWHRLKNQRPGQERPLLTLNLQAVPTELLDSELRGHVRGSFTGAVGDRTGALEAASGGTLFLEDAQYMPLEAQRKLITCLEDRIATPIGSQREYKLAFDLIVATNRHPSELVAQKAMLPDFQRRLQVNPVKVPSLRERGPVDIKLLCEYFITQCLEAVRSDQPGEVGGPRKPERTQVEHWFTKSALDVLYHYEWPSNVGQLRNLFQDARVRYKLMEGARRVAGPLDAVTHVEVEEILGHWRIPSEIASSPAFGIPLSYSFDEAKTLAEMELARHVDRVNQLCGGVVKRTADRLGCKRATVYKYLNFKEGPDDPDKLEDGEDEPENLPPRPSSPRGPEPRPLVTR